MLESRFFPDRGSDEKTWSYLEVGLVRGASQLVECRSATPLRIINPKMHAPSCHVLVTNYGGGMVEGDCVYLKVVCQDGASLHVGSVGNLQVYGNGVKGCSHNLEGFVGNRALCVIHADPVVLHSGSIFRQKQIWNVRPGGSLLIAEWVVAGRLEIGERFDFVKYVSDVTVLIDDRPLIVDRFEFQPQLFDYHDPAFFGGLACLLNIYFVGSEWIALENLLSEAIDHRQKVDSETLAAICETRDHDGCILRALSPNRRSLDWVTGAIYEFLSQEKYLGFNPLERKY